MCGAAVYKNKAKKRWPLNDTVVSKYLGPYPGMGWRNVLRMVCRNHGFRSTITYSVSQNINWFKIKLEPLTNALSLAFPLF